MRNNMENLLWLIENGGPTIKLYMMHESLVDKSMFDIEKLSGEVLKLEQVQTKLDYFDAFKDYKAMTDRELYALVHNCYDNCYERFMPYLIKIGLKAGISEFDVKTSCMRDVYKFLIGTGWSHVYGLIIILNMLKAGYYYDDMLGYMTTRVIDKIHKTAELKSFDIYETDTSKIRQPNKWSEKLILKDIHNCEIGELPLPTEYHISGIINLYNYVNDNETKKKINDVIEYILHPQYQRLHGDYGWHWSGKTYHASSAGINLPLYDDFELSGHQKWTFLWILELMSYSPVACKSEWMKKCVNYLETFKTERATYIFPEDLLYSELVHKLNMPTMYQAFISQDILSKIKSNGRKPFLFEVYSTYYMIMLKSRLQRFN